MRLAGATAIVTGGGSGLGRATAEAFTAKGARVVICDRNAAAANEAAKAIGCLAAACDVDPDYFAEYRLAAAMRELDPAEVGLEQALENLNARLGARRQSAARGRASQLPQAQPRPTG